MFLDIIHEIVWPIAVFASVFVFSAALTMQPFKR